MKNPVKKRFDFGDTDEIENSSLSSCPFKSPAGGNSSIMKGLNDISYSAGRDQRFTAHFGTEKKFQLNSL